MRKISSFSDVIGLFGPKAVDFGRAIGIGAELAANMKRRDSIDAKHFNRVVEAAASLGCKDVTHKLLSDLAEKRSRKKPSVAREVDHAS